jgi:hypothetical protein
MRSKTIESMKIRYYNCRNQVDSLFRSRLKWIHCTKFVSFATETKDKLLPVRVSRTAISPFRPFATESAGRTICITATSVCRKSDSGRSHRSGRRSGTRDKDGGRADTRAKC